MKKRIEELLGSYNDLVEKILKQPRKNTCGHNTFECYDEGRIDTIDKFILDLSELIKENENDIKARNNSWMQTFTGKEFYPWNPQAHQLSLIDIAHVLSREGRFGFHASQDYSVAEHCIRGAYLLRSNGYDEKYVKAFLLHDASEAYVRDLASPVKAFVSEYKDVENIIQRSINFKYLGYPELSAEVKYIVKSFDIIMLYHEAKRFVGDIENWNFPDRAYVYERYDVKFGWKPMSKRKAEKEFLKLCKELDIKD